MCVVCGCSGPGAEVLTAPGAAVRDLDFGANGARVSVPGMSTERAIQLEARVLGANDAVAQRNRAHFAAHRVQAYNLVSSPGSGKTTLLAATIQALRRQQPRVGRRKVLRHADRATKRHDRDFNALARQRIGQQLSPKLRKPLLQLSNARACHRRRGVEQQHTRTTGLGIGGELDGRERQSPQIARQVEVAGQVAIGRKGHGAPQLQQASDTMADTPSESGRFCR